MNSLERDRTFKLVPRVFSLSNNGKREDPGNEVGERLSWLGQAREFILIKTLSVLPWGHWRQISHQSAPPSNRLFVITRILEDTWPDPARVSRTWERGCLHVTWRPVSWQGWKTKELFTFTGRVKIISSLNLRQNRKNALGKSLKPQINLKRYFFTFIPLLSSDFSDLVMHLSMLSPRVGGGGAGYPREIDWECLPLGRDFDI